MKSTKEELRIEENTLPTPLVINLLNMEKDQDRIRSFSFQFAYGSQIVHVSQKDFYSFLNEPRVVVFNAISSNDETSDRTDALIQSFSKRMELLHELDNALILIQTSNKKPVEMNELATLMSFFVSHLAYNASIQYGIGTRAYLGNRIRLLAVCN